MKKFDKGYIYSSLLSDLFSSLVVVFIFLKDFFFDESSNPADIMAAIPFFVIGFAVGLGFLIYAGNKYNTNGSR